MAWNDVIARFGSAAGVDGFGLDADGRAALVFDDALGVEFAADGEGLWLLGAIGPLPDFAREDFYRAMLMANHPGRSDGSFLGLDADGGAVLAKRFDAEAEDAAFASALEAFLQRLGEWKGRVADA